MNIWSVNETRAIKDVLLSNEVDGDDLQDAQALFSELMRVQNSGETLPPVNMNVKSGSTWSWFFPLARLLSLASSAPILLGSFQFGPPGASANPIPTASPNALFKAEIDSYGFDIVSTGLDSFNGTQREYFTRTLENSIAVTAKAIEVLEKKHDRVLENKLVQWGVDPSIRKPLQNNYEGMKGVLLWMKEDAGNDIYIVKPRDVSDPLEAINLVVDNHQRVAISKRFFKKCAVPAINTLLHEVGHLCCNKIDMYYFSREASCLDLQQNEKSLRVQLDDFVTGYEHSIAIGPDSMGGESYLSFLSNNTQGMTLPELYRNNSETKILVDYINADFLSALAIVLAYYDYKEAGGLRLRETSEYKVPLTEGERYLES